MTEEVQEGTSGVGTIFLGLVASYIVVFTF